MGTSPVFADGEESAQGESAMWESQREPLDPALVAPGSPVVHKSKNPLQMIQEDFPKTPSPVYQKGRKRPPVQPKPESYSLEEVYQSSEDKGLNSKVIEKESGDASEPPILKERENLEYQHTSSVLIRSAEERSPQGQPSKLEASMAQLSLEQRVFALS
jgi:hypothetical protein